MPHRPSTSLLSPRKRSSSSASSKYLFGRVTAGVVAFSISTTIFAEKTEQRKEDTTPPASGLKENEFTPLKLKRVMPYNHNTNVYYFSLPNPDADLNLPVSACILVRFIGKDGKDVVRPYTPIPSRKGELVLLIKSYEDGNMSKHISQLHPGDKLEVKGPVPKLKYEPNMKKQIGMIAGGTGITPMIQVLYKILFNPADKTKVYLLYANKSPADILAKEYLSKLARQFPDRFNVTFVVDSDPSGKVAETGHIDEAMIRRNFPFAPSDGDNVLIYVCGTPAMYKSISGPKAKDYTQGEISGALKNLGYNSSQVYKF